MTLWKAALQSAKAINTCTPVHICITCSAPVPHLQAPGQACPRPAAKCGTQGPSSACIQNHGPQNSPAETSSAIVKLARPDGCGRTHWNGKEPVFFVTLSSEPSSRAPTKPTAPTRWHPTFKASANSQKGRHTDQPQRVSMITSKMKLPKGEKNLNSVSCVPLWDTCRISVSHQVHCGAWRGEDRKCARPIIALQKNLFACLRASFLHIK